MKFFPSKKTLGEPEREVGEGEVGDGEGEGGHEGFGEGLAHLGGCCLDAGGPTTGTSCLRAGRYRGPTHSHDSSSSCSSAPLLQRTETQPLPRSTRRMNRMSSDHHTL